MKPSSDLEIISQIRKGNTRAFEVLVEKYKDKAFSLLLSILHNKYDAEEVLQDSFLKAFNGLKYFRHEAKFSTWFYRIVYNSALSFLKSKRKKQEKITDSINENVGSQIQFEEENKISYNYIYKFIEKLPPRNALIIVLFYLDELSLKEISELLDISVANVKILLYRSRAKLKELILENNYLEELK